MGLYTERVLPRITNFACGAKALDPLRIRACQSLTRAVVEIGFGSGPNVPFYPSSITHVAAIEPTRLGWQLAAERVQAAPVPVRWSGPDGQRLPVPDDSFDAALSTWTLCTIPDVAAALTELRRVLKPNGTFHFLEHGLAPDEPVRRWQRRVEPVQKRLFGGCRLTRPITDLVTEAGFIVTELDAFYQQGAPKCGGAIYLGAAKSASTECAESCRVSRSRLSEL